jgi:hypothetical protein
MASSIVLSLIPSVMRLMSNVFSCQTNVEMSSSPKFITRSGDGPRRIWRERYHDNRPSSSGEDPCNSWTIHAMDFPLPWHAERGVLFRGDK